MFNNKYQEYEQVANHDSGDEIELQQRSSNNTLQQPVHSSITDLLKLTAHRRIRSQSNSQSLDVNNNNNNTVITISDDDDTDIEDDESQNLLNKPTPTENEDIMDDIDLLDNAHATTDTEGEEEDDETIYDDHVFLLSLDGKKRKVGIMTSWKIRQLKEKYFKSELKDGKNIRLIYRGKLLQDIDDINSYNIPSMGFIHVSVSKGRNLNGTGENGQFGTGDVNYDNFDDGMDDEAVARRLQEEINAGLMNDNIPRWMRGGDNRWNDDEDRTNPDRARREFLCGVFLGCVAGIWILIFLILLAQRNQYSRRFRLGVTIGVGINLMINLSYQYNNDNNSDDPAEDINNTSETDTGLSGDIGDGGVDDMGNGDGQEIETAAN